MVCYIYKINVIFFWDFGWYICSSFLIIVCWLCVMYELDLWKVMVNFLCLVNLKVKVREVKKRYLYENGYFKVVNNELCWKILNCGF